MQQVGGTAAWMVNMDDIEGGADLSNAAVAEWISVVADVLQSQDPLQLPVFVEADSHDETE